MIVCGETLRVLRQIKGIKQQVIAKELGISQPAYSQIERRDYIDCKKFEKILSVLGYSTKELRKLTGNYLAKENG
jgi:transcriptional regulator with XRE-family HTH domain